MASLLGALLGFISAMLPECLRLWRERADRGHELALFDRQILLRLLEKEEPREPALPPDVSVWSEMPLASAGKLASSVRPVLAYGFFLLYAGIKLRHGERWNEEDAALFAGVVSFYFGQRTFRRRG